MKYIMFNIKNIKHNKPCCSYFHEEIVLHSVDLIINEEKITSYCSGLLRVLRIDGDTFIVFHSTAQHVYQLFRPDGPFGFRDGKDIRCRKRDQGYRP